MGLSLISVNKCLSKRLLVCYLSQIAHYSPLLVITILRPSSTSSPVFLSDLGAWSVMVHVVMCCVVASLFQGEQTDHAAAGVAGQPELPDHHDCPHLGLLQPLFRNPVHHPDRLQSAPNEEEENKGWWDLPNTGGGGFKDLFVKEVTE